MTKIKLAEIRIVAIPRDPNPYQESLYGPMRQQRADVRYAGSLTGSHTVNLALLPLELVCLRLRGFEILHLHWTYGFRFPWSGQSRVAGALSRAWFVLVLKLSSLLGLRVVWTAHNKLPHGPVFDDDVKARRSLIRIADLVIAHTSVALTELAKFGVEARSAAVVPHGPLGPPALRAIPPPAPGPKRTVLFFGRIEPYKGVHDLLAAMRHTSSDLNLVIAGNCADPRLRAEIELTAAADQRIECRFGHIPDSELPALFGRADGLVFPFRAITTSGSLHLGMSSARPVIVPDLAALSDLPVDATITYPSGTEGLAHALNEVATMPAEDLRRKGLAAREVACSVGWEEIAARTLAELRGLRDSSGGRPATERAAR